MTTPQTELFSLVLRQIDREAEVVEEFNITSKAAREKLAHNIYGNIAMWMKGQVAELVKAARRAQEPLHYASHPQPDLIPIDTRICKWGPCVALREALANAKKAGLL